jgi:phage/plasmid-like protein (TIGR03299 family)
MEILKQKPWYGIGVEVDANLSSREMLYKAKLDWEVSKIPSQRPKSYGNQETIRFFKGFFEAGEAEIETVGALDAARILWGLARLNEDFTLKGGDEVKSYVLLASRDEGREKIEVHFLTVRKSCHNMLKIASDARPHVKNIFRRTFKPVFPFLNQKTQKFDDEMKKKANEMIRMGRTAISAFAVDAQCLADKRVDEPMAWRYLFDVFQPETLKDVLTFEEKDWDKLAEKKTKLAIETFFSQAPGQELESASMTAWGLLNAVTYTVDHLLGPNQDSRLRQAWFGPNAKLKKRALDLALVL